MRICPNRPRRPRPATLGQARLRWESRHCEEPRAFVRTPVCRRALATKQSRRTKSALRSLDRFDSLAMTDQTARRRGRCAFSLARSRSRPWPKCPTGLLCVSAGGEFCTTSRPSRGRSASPRPGGDTPTRRRATISAPRIRKAAASGFIARAYGAARRRRRNGLCMACSGERSTPPSALDARARWRTTCR